MFPLLSPINRLRSSCRLLAMALLALAFIPKPPALANPPSRPVVGAIRWDGWSLDGPVGHAVSTSLSPLEWHYRWPFFAKTREDGALELRGDTPEVMSAEIAAAKTAHLDYWAFLAYDEADSMTRGLQLYLANPHRSDVNFCLISETARWQRANTAALADRFSRLMAEPGYQRVAGGRPIFYFLHHNTETVAKVWGGPAGFRAAVELLKAAVVARGLPAPYLAVMTYDVNGAKALLDGAGLDAISAYAFQRGDTRAPYGKLTGDLEALWEIQRSTKASVIPLAMTGWDRRPRVQNPVPWEHFGGALDQYYETATPDQVAAHVGTAVQWVQNHAPNCPAQAVMIYAWNEFDEGGWLCPTLVEGDARVQALGRTLKPHD